MAYSSFNKNQQQAIAHKTGPAMVIAGPGSGKTTVITNRVKRLIESGTAKPQEILVITFTVAAASEMKARYLKLCEAAKPLAMINEAAANASTHNASIKAAVSIKAASRQANALTLGSAPVQDYSKVTFGTFHSVFYQFLRRIPRYAHLKLAEPTESINILKAIVRSQYPNSSSFTSDYYTYVLNRISFIKNTENVNAVASNIDNVKSKPSCNASLNADLPHQVMKVYQQELLKHGLIDFDDMLVLFHKCLIEDAGFRSLMRQRFKFILIDEFQDINRIQFESVRMLAAPLNNLFVVGDDDQSIYAFRGSDPTIMLRFKDYYPDAKYIELFTNYRSSRYIIKTASKLISHNKDRYDKQFEAIKELRLPVATRSFRTQAEEAQFIVADILKLPKELKTVGILYRTHRTGSIVKEAVQSTAHTKAQAQSDSMTDTQSTAGRKSQTQTNIQTQSNTQTRCNTQTQSKTQTQAGSQSKPGSDINLGDHLINFMTFHACKGLEFDAVYIISANEDITPSKSSGKDGISEERRLFYVAMTRAKQFLHISDTRFIYNKTQIRSRFVREAIGAKAAAGDIFRNIING